jgi:hypothetical protein
MPLPQVPSVLGPLTPVGRTVSVLLVGTLLLDVGNTVVLIVVLIPLELVVGNGIVERVETVERLTVVRIEMLVREVELEVVC